MNFLKKIANVVISKTPQHNLGKFELLIVLLDSSLIMQSKGDLWRGSDKLEIKGATAKFDVPLPGLIYHKEMLLLQTRFSSYALTDNKFEPEKGKVITKKLQNCYKFHLE